MRKLVADKVAAIQPSGIRKFFDIVSEMDDVISLGVGEPDFDTPWHIRDEGIYSLEKGRTYYTSMPDSWNSVRRSANMYRTNTKFPTIPRVKSL